MNRRARQAAALLAVAATCAGIAALSVIQQWERVPDSAAVALLVVALFAGLNLTRGRRARREQ